MARVHVGEGKGYRILGDSVRMSEVRDIVKTIEPRAGFEGGLSDSSEVMSAGLINYVLLWGRFLETLG